LICRDSFGGLETPNAQPDPAARGYSAMWGSFVLTRLHYRCEQPTSQHWAGTVLHGLAETIEIHAMGNLFVL